VRVAVVDLGTNSTRLLVADVRDGRVRELERRSTVTRLGAGVDRTGSLGEEAQARVFAVLDEYSELIERHRCQARLAVLTSAVRDARNGEAFQAAVRERHGLDARTISGEEEARLTFLGATAARDPGDRTPLVVIDIGGGSTELVCGAAGEVTFRTSTQIGVVRQSERHLHHDPPQDRELEALSAEVRTTLSSGVPEPTRTGVRAGIAVAGTPTSAAGIELGAYDRDRVEGHRLTRNALRAQLGRLAAMPLAERREVPGLHRDRAPMIVAGLIVLLEILDLFELTAVTASERDILWGAALERAGDGAGRSSRRTSP